MRFGLVIMILCGTALFAGGVTLSATPIGCYRSATGELQLGRLARSFFGDRRGCDPLAVVDAPIPNKPFWVGTSINAYAGPAGFDAFINPDGSGEIGMAMSDRLFRFSGQQASYRIIAQQIAPLMMYAGTPHSNGSSFPKMDLPVLNCGTEPPGYHSGLSIAGSSSDNAPDFDQYRMFTLECEGPAGESLRARAEIVSTELDKLAQTAGVTDSYR